jgi:uncharacterized protein (DUF1778 family)
MAQQTRNKRLDLRVRPDQDELIRAAADARSQSVSEFLIESAIARAEMDAGERSHFVIAADQWDVFVAELDRPPELIDQLDKLLG